MYTPTQYFFILVVILMQKVNNEGQLFDKGARPAQIPHQQETVGTNWLRKQFLT